MLHVRNTCPESQQPSRTTARRCPCHSRLLSLLPVSFDDFLATTTNENPKAQLNHPKVNCGAKALVAPGVDRRGSNFATNHLSNRVWSNQQSKLSHQTSSGSAPKCQGTNLQSDNRHLHWAQWTLQSCEAHRQSPQSPRFWKYCIRSVWCLISAFKGSSGMTGGRNLGWIFTSQISAIAFGSSPFLYLAVLQVEVRRSKFSITTERSRNEGCILGLNSTMPFPLDCGHVFFWCRPIFHTWSIWVMNRYMWTPASVLVGYGKS